MANNQIGIPQLDRKSLRASKSRELNLAETLFSPGEHPHLFQTWNPRIKSSQARGEIR